MRIIAMQLFCKRSGLCGCLARGAACGKGSACSLGPWHGGRAVCVAFRRLSPAHGAGHLLDPLRATLRPPTCASIRLISSGSMATVAGCTCYVMAL